MEFLISVSSAVFSFYSTLCWMLQLPSSWFTLVCTFVYTCKCTCVCVCVSISYFKLCISSFPLCTIPTFSLIFLRGLVLQILYLFICLLPSIFSFYIHMFILYLYLFYLHVLSVFQGSFHLFICTAVYPTIKFCSNIT